jgi:hypothetical protein
MLERFKAMPPDQQQQFIARLKDRGSDVSAFERAAAKPAPKPAAKTPTAVPKYGAVQSGETIDALFAPLPTVVSQGRAWVYMGKQLKPVRLRLGITDGTYTELLSGELQPGMEVVTGIVMTGTPRITNSAPGAGNPLMGPQRGRGRGR